MKYQAQISDKRFDIFFQQKENKFEVEIDGEKLWIDLKQVEGTNSYLLFLKNHLFEVEVEKNEASYLLHYRGKSYCCKVEDERFAKLKNSIRQQSGSRLETEITSPMPGLVVAIEVKPGQPIKKGEGLLIIEAMKMENEIKAPFDCLVKEIKVQEKQAVEKGQVLVVFGA